MRALTMTLALLAASCGPSPNGPGPSEPGEDVEFGGPETMYTLAEVGCPAGGVTAIWRGVTVRPAALKDRGLRSVRVRFADGEELELASMDVSYDWPEVAFSPDCRRAALLRSRHGPYLVVATQDLRRHLRGESVPVRYLDDQEGCALEFVYQGLRWLSNDTVEYRSGGEPMATRRVNVDQAPDHLIAKPCTDPKSQLYQEPGGRGGK